MSRTQETPGVFAGWASGMVAISQGGVTESVWCRREGLLKLETDYFIAFFGLRGQGSSCPWSISILCVMKIPWPSWGVIEVHQQLLASKRSWHRSITSWKTSQNQSLFPEVLKPHIHWYANSWISLVTSCNLQICNTMVDFVSKLTSEPTKYGGYLAPMEAHDLLPKSSVGIGGCRFWRLFREVHNMLLVTMSSL